MFLGISDLSVMRWLRFGESFPLVVPPEGDRRGVNVRHRRGCLQIPPNQGKDTQTYWKEQNPDCQGQHANTSEGLASAKKPTTYR